ncbi:hypothetical protein MKEN_00390300 [Mycena kentingensis (nom. inval.)]|nr:hypothetical protein MKEN_00390300 [Mycena kentingensis (nom. inval.)]
MPPSRPQLHPSLDRRNIERLPLKQRLYASAALDITEPPSKLGDFIDDHLREKTSFDISVILPIVYANLEGFNPPDFENLEERANKTLQDPDGLAASVLRPIYAIELLSAVVVDTPPAAMPTLWPHVWRWTAHFRAHHPYYTRGPGFMEDVTVGLYISLFTARILLPCLRSEKQSFQDQVMSTPGLAGAVFYTWSRIAADQREDTGFDAVKKHFYQGLFDYLDHASRDSQQNRFWLNLDDVAEGAGSVDDLAATVLRTIYTDLGRRSEDGQARGLRTMLRLIDVLSPSVQGHMPFWNALLQQHVTARVVARTCACFSSLDRATQRHAFSSITRSLKYSTDPAQLAAASTYLAELGWLSLLSQGLVHRAVVAAVQRAFPDLQHVMSKPQLRRSPYPPYYRPFIDFIALYRLRFEILEKVRARESTSSSPQAGSHFALDSPLR